MGLWYYPIIILQSCSLHHGTMGLYYSYLKDTLYSPPAQDVVYVPLCLHAYIHTYMLHTCYMWLHECLGDMHVTVW